MQLDGLHEHKIGNSITTFKLERENAPAGSKTSNKKGGSTEREREQDKRWKFGVGDGQETRMAKLYKSWYLSETDSKTTP